MAEQPVLVLGEAGGVERWRLHVHVQEPFEEQVVLELLAELPLAANRVQGDQQATLEQVLGRDAGPAVGRVHGVEDRRQFRQGPVDDHLDPSQRVIEGAQLLRGQGGEHRDLLSGAAAHSRSPAGTLPYKTLTSLFNPASFSAPC
jgi:hypothetical protein